MPAAEDARNTGNGAGGEVARVGDILTLHRVFPWTGSVIAGILCGWFGWPAMPTWLWMAASAISVILATAVRLRLPWRRDAALVVQATALLCLGAFLAAAEQQRQPVLPDALLPLLGQSVTMEGRLDAWQRLNTDRQSFLLRVSRIALPPHGELVPWKATVLVRLPAGPSRPAPWRPGDALRVQGRLELPRLSGNPGAFDYGAWLRQEGVAALLRVRRADTPVTPVHTNDQPTHGQLLDAYRLNMAESLTEDVPSPLDGVVRALSLGERSATTESMRMSFRNAGTAHLLAISGLHMGIVAWWFFGLMKLLFLAIPRRRSLADLRASAALPTLALTWAYVVLTGASVSTVRAGIMVSMLLLGLLLRGRLPPGQSLAWAALLILLMQPSSLLGVSFQLSFAAVAGIYLFRPLAARVARKMERRLDRMLPGGTPAAAAWVMGQAWDLAWVSMASFVATAPIILATFKQFVLAGLLVNLWAVPWTTLISVPLGLSGVTLTVAGCSQAGQFLAQMQAWSLDLLVRGQDRMVAALSFDPGPRGAAALCALTVCLGMWLLLRGRIRRHAANAAAATLAGVLAALWLWPAGLPTSGASMVVLNAGFRHAILVTTPAGQTLLIDGGGDAPAGTLLRDALTTLGLRTPDAWLCLDTRNCRRPPDMSLPQPVDALALSSGASRELLPEVSVIAEGIAARGQRSFLLTVADRRIRLLRNGPAADAPGVRRRLEPADVLETGPTWLSRGMRQALTSGPVVVSAGGAVREDGTSAEGAQTWRTGKQGALVCNIAETPVRCRPYAQP